MRSSVDFSSAVRDGRRVRQGRVVVHLASSTSAAAAGPPVVGFIVGKSVGGSVVRHRVSRRLRAIVARQLSSLPSGSATVVRALPGAAVAPSSELAADVDAALERLTGALQ